MRALRSAAVRGELHKRLVTLLDARLRDGVCTQESLATRLEMHQTTVSGIIRRNAGTFDLDEAAAALDHVGAGTLADFAAGVPATPPTDAARVAAVLTERPELLDFLADLLPVPKPRLAEVIELARGLSRLAIARRGGRTRESGDEIRLERRTKSAPAPRRSVRRGKKPND